MNRPSMPEAFSVVSMRSRVALPSGWTVKMLPSPLPLSTSTRPGSRLADALSAGDAAAADLRGESA